MDVLHVRLSAQGGVREDPATEIAT
jgi:hypothetical protein